MGEPDFRPMPPRPEDAKRWDEAAISYDLEQLTRMKANAERWATTLTSLLGLFGTVVIVKGTDELAKFSNFYWRLGLVALTIGAGYLTVKATLAAFDAASGQVSLRNENFNGDSYRDQVGTQTKNTYDDLKTARTQGLLAVSAVALIGLAGLVNSLLPEGGAPAPSVLVVDGAGKLHCGTVNANSKGVAKVAGQTVTGITSVTPVPKCAQ